MKGTPGQQHLGSLDHCTCGAHLYLVMRSRKTGISIGLLHVQPGIRGRQDMKVLTFFQNHVLKFHDLSKKDPGDLGQLREILAQHARDELAYLTHMLKSDKVSPGQQQPGKNRAQKHPKKGKDHMEKPLLTRSLKKDERQGVLPQ